VLVQLAAPAAAPRVDAPADHLIEGLLNRFAPIGLKKKFYLIPGGDPRLDERYLPPFRTVQAPDEEELLDGVGEYVATQLRTPAGPIPGDQRTAVLREVVDFLFARLEREVSVLTPEGLLQYLVAANEAILTAQARRQLTIPTRLACFGSAEALAEQLRRDLPEASKAASASRVLIEYVTARPPQGERRLSLATYDRLLATASDIQEWAFVSDDIHFGLADHALEMLPSGRLGVSREEYLVARDSFLGVLARGEMGRSADDFSRHWKGGTSNASATIFDDEETRRATAAEFGLPIGALVDFLWAVIQIGDHQDSAAKTASVNDLLAEVRADLGWSEEDTRTAFEQFAAYPRPDFLNPPPPFVAKDAWPWNFNRALSYLRKPLLVRPGEPATVVWGNRNVYLAGLTLVSLCSSARLKARSPEMRRLIGRLRNLESESFNDRVADLYQSAVPEMVVRRRLWKVGRQKIRRESGEDLGDIDVLVADPTSKRMFAVETKDLAVARTPAELHNELEAVFEARGVRSASVDKHLERVAWLRTHLPAVLTELRLSAENATTWSLEPLVVVNLESLAPYLATQRIRVVSFEELRRGLGSSIN
jgi:hypothetical protein